MCGLAAILAVLALVLALGNKAPGEGNVTVVTAPDQKEAMENEQFTVVEYVPTEIDGVNVALDGLCEANGYTDVYVATYANDGSRDGGSYWEGPSGKESMLQLIMKESHVVHTIRIALNPSTLWGKRTQTMSIETSMDGENYTELVPMTDYEFDPDTGNEITIPVDNVEAKYVRLNITKNTGAVSGQVAELEVYANE